jgi:hypothetical protein
MNWRGCGGRAAGARSLNLAELVEVYLAQHDVEQVMTEKDL